jgi:DHA1 family bicyclomycin/chloramphenicol resistance-like MFS transporter
MAEGKLKIRHQVLTGETLTPAQRRTYIIVIGLLATLLPFSVDFILPAFPSIGLDFHAADSAVQLTFTGVTIGFAIGQLIAGPLADAIGRRRPMLIFSALHLAGSLLCFISPTIDFFFFSRLIQGIGGAGAAVLMGAIVRDLYVGGPMVTMVARISLISGLAPVLAPIIGSQLVTALPWRFLFVFLTVYAGLVWLATYKYLIETLHREDRRSSGARVVLMRFKAVLADRIYVGILIYSVLQMVALFGYLNIVPFLYQGTYGLSPAAFGLVFASNSMALYIGTQLAAKISRMYPAQWILIICAALFGFAGVGLIFAGLARAELLPVQLLVMVMLFSFGASLPLTSALSLAQHPAEAGTAASLMGVLNFAFTSLLSGFYPLLGTKTSTGMGFWVSGCLTLGVLALFFVMKPKSVPALKQ